jgi:hypothetical protein
MPHLPRGRATTALDLRNIDRVFPLTTIPERLASWLFYEVVTQYVRWLLLPFVVASVAYDVITHALGRRGDVISDLIVELGSDVLLLLVLALFLFIARRMANRSMRSAALYVGQTEKGEKTADTSVEEIRGRLESGQPPPLGDEVSGACLRGVGWTRTSDHP